VRRDFHQQVIRARVKGPASILLKVNKPHEVSRTVSEEIIK
jgi:hypothetical protein